MNHGCISLLARIYRRVYLKWPVTFFVSLLVSARLRSSLLVSAYLNRSYIADCFRFGWRYPENERLI